MDIVLHRAARKVWDDTSAMVKWVLQRGSFIKYIGIEQPEGATAPLTFYLFWCSRCERPAKDYAHGFSGKQSVVCSGCGAYHRIRRWHAYMLQGIAQGKLLFLSIYWRLRPL